MSHVPFERGEDAWPYRLIPVPELDQTDSLLGRGCAAYIDIGEQALDPLKGSVSFNCGTGIILHRPSRGNRRVGLLGGAFDPAHAGHRAVSMWCLRALQLDAVWWLVAPSHPLKHAANPHNLAQRLAGARRITRDDPRIVISDLESRYKICYTYEVIKDLKKACPQTRFVWIMGADNAMSLHSWKHWQRLLAEVPVLVYDRAGEGARVAASPFAVQYRDARHGLREAPQLVTMLPPAWMLVRARRYPQASRFLRVQSYKHPHPNQ